MEGSQRPFGRMLMLDVRFGVLGPVTVTRDSLPLNIGGPKQRTVLAMLIAHAGHPVAIDRIIDAVWGDDAAPNAKRIVQTYVATLRHEVGEVIVKAGSGWKLDVPSEAIDALDFENLYNSAREVLDSSPQRASVALREALAMWHGHPYSDIDGHGLLDGETSRLTELRVAAQAARIECDLALGRDADLVGELEALMAEHPYSERFRSSHMLALYRAGRQREALRSYQEMRALLLEELGVDPTPDLQHLERRILEQDESLQVSPRQKIRRRAILVVDPGDPIEIGHLPTEERDDLLRRITTALNSELDRSGETFLVNAGATNYVVFDDARAAASVAEALMRRLDGQVPRVAIDWGDLLLEDGRVSGPPVSRAAVMTAVAHNGQVLLSAEAQQAVGSAGSGRGLRFENLGSYELHGVEGAVLIYQLLVGDTPAVFPELETHRLPPPLPGGGDRSVPGYELREVMGPGSVGTLYRAFQPSVGREVLVEVIARTDSSGADFVRNFEADAQRLSLLDHQNVAPVIDYWRQPDGAFLVYRYPRGSFLSAREVVDGRRVVNQVGYALSYAHSLGIAHGSVRPDRVALDEAGNASLLCFPIAGVSPRAHDEYEAFVAPELSNGAPATVGADIYALGVLALHLGLEGDVVDRATDVDPDRRPSSIDLLLGEIQLGELESPSERFTETRNPYKGLAAFHEFDSVDFFGRASVTEELCQKLEGSRMLAIIGPSGVGKSSVARAGLLPALRAGRIPGSEKWLITDMFPGGHPFLELQRALARVAVDLTVPLTDSLAAHQPTALDSIRDVLPDRSELLVLVDQFEELFTMTEVDERRLFLELIETAVTNGSARFVVTLRADFLDRPLRYSEFGALLKKSGVMLTSPGPDELSEAIVQPAAGVGVEVAPELAERLVAEVHDQPGALPLLQHTLAELFAARSSDLIGTDDLRQIGGVSGSVANRSESIYARLSEPDRAKVEQVFLRLVTIVDESVPTRRRVRETELSEIGAEQSVDAFARNRLLVMDSDPETRIPTVEVAHEALLSHWPRLAGWIDSAREDILMLRRLDEAREEWEASGQEPQYLLTGGRLAQHEAWTATTSLALSQAEERYLSASREHDSLLRRRSRRRRGAVMAGFGVAAAVAVVFALSASRNAAEARISALTQESLNIAADDPELGILLAGEAIEAAHARGIRPPAETFGALWSAYVEQRALYRHDVPGGEAVAFDPEGELIAIDLIDDEDRRALVLMNWQTGEIVAQQEPDRSDASKFAIKITFSPDGNLIAVARMGRSPGDAVVEVLSAADLSLVSRLSGPEFGFFALDFASDGMLLVRGAALEAGVEMVSLAMWDPVAGVEVARVPDLGSLVKGVVTSLHTQLLPGSHTAVVGFARGDQPFIGLIDLDHARLIEQIATDTWHIGLAVSPDGSVLATSDSTNLSVSFWEIASWKRVGNPVTLQDPQILSWSADSLRLAVSGNDSNLTVISPDSTDRQVLSGHHASIFSSTFHPSDPILASVSVEGEMRLWDVTEAGPADGITVGDKDVEGLVTSGNLIVLDLPDELRLISADSGILVSRAEGVVFPAIAEEALTYGVTAANGVASIHSSQGALEAELPFCTAIKALSTDGRLVLLDTWDVPTECLEISRSSVVLDIGTGEVVKDFGNSYLKFGEFIQANGKDYLVTTVAAEPYASDVRLEVWALDPAEQVGSMESGLMTPILSLKASPADRFLAVGTNGPSSMVIDLESLLAGSSIEDAIIFDKETHSSNAWIADVTDDGLVATAAFDGFYRWWDLESGDLLFEIEVHELRGASTQDVSPDDRYFFYEDGNGIVRRIPTDFDEIVAQAMGSLTRDFTFDECERYLDGEDCALYIDG